MKPDAAPEAADLRRRAEEQLPKEPEGSAQPHTTQSHDDRLVHELQVHQIELAMQNEALQQAQAQLESVLARYTDLYDFAPMGYLTLQSDGAITQTNLAAARILDTERARLQGMRLGVFVSENELSKFNAFLAQVFAGEPAPVLEIMLIKSGRPTRVIEIEAALSADGQECRAMLVDISARTLAEATLRESEAKFSSAFEYAAAGMALVSLNGHWLKVNQSVCAMLGYSVAELLEFNIHDSTFVDDIAADQSQLNDLLNGHTQSFQRETRYVHRKGNVVWGWLSVSLVRSAQNEPRFFIYQILDITPRKKAELRDEARSKAMSLVASGAPLKDILDAIVLGVEAEQPGTVGSLLLLDETGKHLVVGAAPSMPQAFKDAIDGLAIGPNVGSCGTAAYTGKRVLAPEIQTDALWSDYRDFAKQFGLAACFSEPIAIESGRVLGTFAIYHGEPLTPSEDELDSLAAASQLASIAIERKQAQQALLISTELLENTQSIAQVGGWEVNLINHSMYWTKETYRLNDTSPEEYTPTLESCLEHFLPESRLILEKAMQNAIDHGNGCDLEVEKLTKSGRRIDVRTTCKATIKDGVAIKLQGIFQDITERKQAQIALEAANHELARSNAELEQFAYVASHDLQEPLRSVSSCVQLLKKRYAGTLDARADEFIDHAVSGSLRMQTLIDDLLTYSRVSSAPRAFTEIDSSKSVAAACDNLSKAIEECHASITLDPLPTLSADAGQLTQLFQNLIGNSLRFRGGKPAEIHISAKRQNGDWLFSVTDHGIGIERQYFSRIFKLFQRLHTRDEYEGTGIGLTICQRIIERHRGRIWVDSEPGVGTTFYFTIPALSTAERSLL